MTAKPPAQPRPPHPLESLFCPRSIAVLGVTPTPGTVPNDIFRNILTGGFTGVLYPVAPGKRSISAVPAYRYVLDIPGTIDLAVIVFPANVVDKAIEQCAAKGVKGVIVISAGFRETGADGLARERRLRDVCREHDIQLIGPNCLGLINTDPAVALNASFARKMPDHGRIAFLSQSGALCTAVLDYARGQQIGFSKFVSFGNKAGVSEVDLLEYLHADEQTAVILLYLEELSSGRALIEAARRVTRGANAKPILAIKSGRTPQGAHAASSHTGSLAGEDAVCDAVFREAGIIRVTSIEELFNSAILLADQPMPRGDRLAIVTNAGGPGVMATDAAVHAGLQIARFNGDTTQRLKAALPATANIQNPVDVIGDARADRYQAALDAVLADDNVDQALVILTPQSMTDIEDIARTVCRVADSTDKPLTCSFMGACDVADGIALLHARHIPHYILPEWACRAMADVQRVCRWRQSELETVQLPQAAATLPKYLLNGDEGYLSEDRCLHVLQAYGLPVSDHRLCTCEDEAAAFAASIGFPVTLRLVSPQVIHKSEFGGVALNLRDESAVRAAYRDMLARASAHPDRPTVTGVIVRRMIPAGHEVILGAKRDHVFGPVLMFGLGGVFVEILRDVTFALAPVGPAAARQMIRQIKAAGILEGARGQPPADLDAVCDCLCRLGRLVHDCPRIEEVDINPLIVAPAGQGAAVADVRIRLGPADRAAVE
ncbi:MAG: succinyl-CoA synthetase subunit alpha [Planctomycetes bacterium ADurb.Bin126]|nr:MAG: succinyl-CoA synthetase subunit alpha [Planctomycetes bacterium ADurb.Bin126]HOD82811.1 acetate--CoA ligase family protein [Phycisphaerae bacterium]HQL75216.1 acetate--CoA ligase family protein [Phycisphaerae bacterium]